MRLCDLFVVIVVFTVSEQMRLCAGELSSHRRTNTVRNLSQQYLPEVLGLRLNDVSSRTCMEQIIALHRVCCVRVVCDPT